MNQSKRQWVGWEESSIRSRPRPGVALIIDINQPGLLAPALCLIGIERFSLCKTVSTVTFCHTFQAIEKILITFSDLFDNSPLTWLR